MEASSPTKTPDPLLAALLLALAPVAVVAQAPVPLIKRLDDPMRAKVLAALAGLIILGFAMVLLAWLGARVTQRYRQGTPYFRPTARPGEHDWTKKPLDSGDDHVPRAEP